MTIQMYSKFQRLLGRFEGVGACLPSDVLDYYEPLIDELEKMIEAEWNGKEDDLCLEST